jgi:predicted heme/steroid binding protein
MKLLSLATLALLTTLTTTFTNAEESKIAMHGKETSQKTQIFYGKILEIKKAMGYKYLRIDEKGKEIWVAIANAPVSVGEKIGYDKKTLMQNFESKALKQKFEEIYFASDVYLAQKPQKPKSMKDMLGLSTQAKDPHAGMGRGMTAEKEVAPSTPFVKKDSYTIEEIYMWRKNLKDQNITIEGKVFKVSHAIMKRDWVHIGDGSGDEKALTDDLVFTASTSTIKSGDTVIAKGSVAVDKDFGYGYFYPVIIENATFEVKK